MWNPDDTAEPELRDYQQACLDAIREQLDAGVRRQLVSLPTGSGKTVVMAQLPSVLNRNRMLLLAHREELLDQAAVHLSAANPRLTVAVEQGQRHAERYADVVIASVQSLARPYRLAGWAEQRFDLVVVDEAHHATAPTYTRILRAMRVEDGGPLVIGFTATPYRGDGQPLANVFDRVVFERSLPELIGQGYLCHVRALRVRSDTSLADVATRVGDLEVQQLAQRVNTDERNSLICSAIEEHAQDRRTILAFAVNVRHVEDLVAQLRARGHRAEGVTGQTGADERAGAIRHARSGETRILVNCGVFTEGFDLPAIDCLVMARPTKSPLLYMQMLGRGSRCAPGKADVLVLDVVDNCGRHSIQTASTAFGLREMDLLGEDVLAVSEDFRAAHLLLADSESVVDARRKLRLQTEVVSGTKVVCTVAEAVDLFAACVPHGVAEDSIFPWVSVGRDHFALFVPGTKEALSLRKDSLGQWQCVAPTGKVAEWVDNGAVFKPADRFVKRQMGAWRTIRKDAAWRRLPVTANQQWRLKRLGVHVLPSDANRGSASSLISVLLLAPRNGRGGEHGGG